MNILLKEKIKNLLREAEYFRGSSTNTNVNEFTWITSDIDHAKAYAVINKVTYGGDERIETFNLNLSQVNLLDLTDWDTDELYGESDLEYFLEETLSDFEILDIMDFSEEEIPLSRLMNKILDQIVEDYEGFKILESDIETIYIRTTHLT